MEKKEELLIDKAIFIAFLMIMALLFCDITVFFQKCYWHHENAIVLETAFISIMIGVLEGYNLFDLLKYHKSKVFNTAFICVVLLLVLLSFATVP